MRSAFVLLLSVIVYGRSYPFFASTIRYGSMLHLTVKQLNQKIKHCDFFNTRTKQALKKSIRLFKHTPGFIPTAQAAIAKTNIVQGLLYELQCAHQLHKCPSKYLTITGE